MAVKYVQRADNTPGWIPQDLVISLFGGSTAVAATPVDGNIFVADQDYELVRVVEVHSTGTASLTFDLKKCTGTTAPASGTTMLASTFDGNSTANTPVTKVVGGSYSGTTFTAGATGLSATQANRRVTFGDRIALDETTAPTGYIGVLQLHLRRIGSPNDQVGF